MFLDRIRDTMRRGITKWVGGLRHGSLDDKPPRRRDSTPRPGPSARQRDRTAEI